MNLAEQAARRIDLASAIGAEPRRWVLTAAAEAQLIADAPATAWSADGALLHGIPIERGRPPVRLWVGPVLAPRPATNG